MSTIAPVATSAAGTHLLADFWGTRAIGSVEELDALVRSAVASAGATLLELAFHQFPTHDAGSLPGGITGYALLAESHVSVHTWPERDYVAIDIFMCGGQRPETALEVMRRALAPTRERVQTARRGVEEDAVETRSTPERSAPAEPSVPERSDSTRQVSRSPSTSGTSVHERSSPGPASRGPSPSALPTSDMPVPERPVREPPTRGYAASGHPDPGLSVSGRPTPGIATSELGASGLAAPGLPTSGSPANEPPLAIGSE